MQSVTSVFSVACISLSMLFATNVHASPKEAICEISNNYDGIQYKGKCLFNSGERGSFTIEHPTKKTIINEVTLINVYVIDKGIAEVRGLTTSGINSRWGQAKRSPNQKACWVGEDFKVCAW